MAERHVTHKQNEQKPDHSTASGNKKVARRVRGTGEAVGDEGTEGKVQI